MKKALIILLSAFSLSAAAQTKSHTETSHSDIKKSIKDDGKTLSININGFKNEQQFHYNQKFKVEGMSKSQKDALVKRITDSLGVPQPPPAPSTPAKK